MTIDKEKFKEEYGVYPITNDDIPEEEKYIMTPEQIVESEKYTKANAAIEYLKQTDWYTARLAETGKPIPEDVKAARAQARLDISSIQE